MPVFRFQLKVFTRVQGSNGKILRLAHASGKLEQLHNSLSVLPFPFMLINGALRHHDRGRIEADAQATMHCDMGVAGAI
jgi:hypothetical protein